MPGSKFVPSESDLIEASKLWLRCELRKAGNQLFLVSGAVIFALVALHVASDAGLRLRLAAAALGVVVWVAAVGLILGMQRLSLPRRTRRQFRQQKSLQGEVRLRWSEDEILFETANAHSRHAWDEFGTWAESGTIILLFHTDRIFNFIPKRALSKSEADDLRSLLGRKVNRDSCLLPRLHDQAALRTSGNRDSLPAWRKPRPTKPSDAVFVGAWRFVRPSGSRPWSRSPSSIRRHLPHSSATPRSY